MDFIKQNKTLKFFLLILVLLNIGILASLWLMNHSISKTPGRNEPMKFLIKEVGFNQEQADQYKLLVDQHRQQANHIREQINEQREQFFNYRESNGKEELLNAITILKKEDEKVLYQHFSEVRKLCKSDEQRQLFDQSISKMLHQMQNPRGAHRPPHGPPPHHP